MNKVVVTGSAGFIGSHLAEELVRRGYQVIMVDDFSTGKMENMNGLMEEPFAGDGRRCGDPSKNISSSNWETAGRGRKRRRAVSPHTMPVIRFVISPP